MRHLASPPAAGPGKHALASLAKASQRELVKEHSWDLPPLPSRYATGLPLILPQLQFCAMNPVACVCLPSPFVSGGMQVDSGLGCDETELFPKSELERMDRSKLPARTLLSHSPSTFFS